MGSNGSSKDGLEDKVLTGGQENVNKGISDDRISPAIDGTMTKDQEIIAKYRELPHTSKMPNILSSYLRTEKLPKQFKGIEEYVVGVRTNLIEEVGGSCNQAQMIQLDGICELLILSKYISTWVAQDPEKHIMDTRGNIRGALTKGWQGFQNSIDKKLSLFYSMSILTEEKKVPGAVAAMRMLQKDARMTNDGKSPGKGGRKNLKPPTNRAMEIITGVADVEDDE